jgi:hypothetical protein
MKKNLVFLGLIFILLIVGYVLHEMSNFVFDSFTPMHIHGSYIDKIHPYNIDNIYDILYEDNEKKKINSYKDKIEETNISNELYNFQKQDHTYMAYYDYYFDDGFKF